MVRLSKRIRDQLKAEGAWNPVEKGREVPESWKAGAAAFEAYAIEANPTPVPFAHLGEDQTDILVYPDVFSYHENFHEISAAYGTSEKMQMYPLASDDGPEDWYDAELAKDWLLALVVKVLESHDLDLASESFGLPEISVPRGVSTAIEHVGAFNHGRFRFRFADPLSFVKACLRAYVYLLDGNTTEEALKTLLLPASNRDKNYQHMVATRLVDYVHAGTGMKVEAGAVEASLFSGGIPQAFKGFTHSHPDVWVKIRTLFWEHKDFPSFQKHVLSSGTAAALGLEEVFPPGPGAFFERSVRDLMVEVVKGLERRHWIDQPGVVVDPGAGVKRGSLVQMVKRINDYNFEVSGLTTFEEAGELATLADTLGCLCTLGCSVPNPLPTRLVEWSGVCPAMWQLVPESCQSDEDNINSSFVAKVLLRVGPVT